MTSSGTFSFQPSIGELVLYAYGLCGIRRPQLAQEHMVDARMAANLMLAQFSNTGPNLWTVDLQTIPLVEGQSTYAVDPATVMILDAYIETGTNPPIDRIIMPISRTEYASFPNKTTVGFPTVYWYDRLISQTITLWQPPDSNTTYTLNFYRYRQVQDANLQSGQTVEVPYLWLDAFANGLAWRLSRSWAPQLTAMLKVDAQESWQTAATQNTENVPMHISPGCSSYYRS